MDTAQKIVGLAQSKLGCRYEYGGTGPEVFDCEGLLDWIMRELGVDDYQQGSAYQFEKYAHVTDLQQGDAVYFRGDEPEPPYPGHVGVFVGMESPGVGRMISALGEAYGVCYSSFSTTVDQASENPGAYWGATRPADLVAAKPEPEPEPEPQPAEVTTGPSIFTAAEAAATEVPLVPEPTSTPSEPEPVAAFTERRTGPADRRQAPDANQPTLVPPQDEDPGAATPSPLVKGSTN